MTPRYSDRKTATCKVTLSCGARVGDGQVLDLTVPGCLLETALVLERGQTVQLRMYLDQQRPMCIDLGIVRWAADGEAGIEFIRMSDEDASRLRWYVGNVEKHETRCHIGVNPPRQCFKDPAPLAQYQA